jgi:uncharacterized surface protein with fasciclin (FAS1) repeats
MHKKLRIVSFILLVAALALLATTAWAAPAEQADTQKSIVDIAKEDGRFTTLLSALEEAGLVDRLQGEGPFTVFAPTDEAFAKLPTGTIEDLFANSQALSDVLSYHVVDGKLMAADVMQQETFEALTGQALTITTEGETVMINGAKVLTPDLEGSNGVIHVIDTVLMPPTGEIVTAQDTTNNTTTTPGGTTTTQEPVAVGCAEDYVVQANDSLSAIADKYLGDIGAYQQIVDANNIAAETNQTYVAIDDPNIISVGQTLCIPGSPQTQTAAQTPTGQPETTAPLNDAAVTADQTQVEVPEGKAALIFENYSFVDLVFDLSGPTADSAVVVPDGKQEFVLEPGQYNYNGHQPGGDFSVSPGTFELKPGEVVRLTCSDGPTCAELPLDETVEPSTGTNK